jgi:hypothetical protein
MGEQQVLEIGTITLDGSGWVQWTDVAADNRGGAEVLIPNHASGVYEVRHAERDRQERIYIGKASDLRLRVRQGAFPHVTTRIHRLSRYVNCGIRDSAS